MRVWLCSRHGSRIVRVSGRRAPDQYFSVRAPGASGQSTPRPSAPSPSGTSMPRAVPTSPSTVMRWPMTPATVVLRLTARSPSNHFSRTGACHSEPPMSRSSASSRAVSASYGAAQSGTGMLAGRRFRQVSITRERSAGSRSRLRSACSRPTASRSRRASSAHAAHTVRCASTASVSSAEQAARAQAPRRALRTRWGSTSAGAAGGSEGSGGATTDSGSGVVGCGVEAAAPRARSRARAAAGGRYRGRSRPRRPGVPVSAACPAPRRRVRPPRVRSSRRLRSQRPSVSGRRRLLQRAGVRGGEQLQPEPQPTAGLVLGDPEVGRRLPVVPALDVRELQCGPQRGGHGRHDVIGAGRGRGPAHPLLQIGPGRGPGLLVRAAREAVPSRSRRTDWRCASRATQDRIEPCFGSYASGFSHT